MNRAVSLPYFKFVLITLLCSDLYENNCDNEASDMPKPCL